MNAIMGGILCIVALGAGACNSGLLLKMNAISFTYDVITINIGYVYLFRTPLVENDIRISV